ncbi:mitochondrial ribosomal protein L1 isoform X2 [Lasioglossum baleicum]
MQTREYAARKGTRERARKRKVKVVVKKVGFIPHSKRESKTKEKEPLKVSPLRKINDNWRSKPIFDVWFTKYHPQRCYSLREAIECHRETHHPTMYNAPNAFINAVFDLYLQKEKKTKYLDKLTNLVDTPHPFNLKEERTILAFCKKPNDNAAATAAGADFVGGVEIIKQIQNGNFNHKEYQYIVAHVDIIPDLLLIRGLLKTKFPNPKMGSMGSDMTRLVSRFKQGIVYNLEPDSTFKEYGVIDSPFGTLDMDIEHLEANFKALIENINSAKPNRDENFIKRVRITSLPAVEWFKLDLGQYIPIIGKKRSPPKQSVPRKQVKSNEEEEEEEPLEGAIIASQ